MLNWLRRNDQPQPNTNGYKPYLNGNGRTEAASTNGTAMIDLRGIKKAYETDAGPFLALKGIDLKVKEGEFVSVVGKSGSGKSTLINMFTGIDHPLKVKSLSPKPTFASLMKGKWLNGEDVTWASSSSSSNCCLR